MGNHAGRESLGVTQWTGGCKVMRFLSGGGAQDSRVLCLISNDDLAL